jgi:hypothetical protein
VPLPADLGFGVKLPSTTFNAVKNAIKVWVEAVNGGGYRLSNVSSVQIAPGALPDSPAAGEVAIDSGASNALKYHNGTAWVTVGGGGASISRAAEDFTGSATDEFTLAAAPIDAGHVTVFVNGIRQRPTTDWSLSGSTITLTFTTDAADVVSVEYWT